MSHQWRTSNEYGSPEAWNPKAPVRKAGTRAVSAGAAAVMAAVDQGGSIYQRSSDVYGGFAQEHVKQAYASRAAKVGLDYRPPSSGPVYASRTGAGPSAAGPSVGVVPSGSGAAGAGSNAAMPPAGINRALVIGVNYTGGSAPLTGCINDAKNALAHMKKWGFQESQSNNFLMLLDEGDRKNYPTRANIVAGMKWLVKDAKAGETLWFHFSGHGSQAADKEKDELDGFDETICPVDYEKAGMITDDDIRKMMVDVLPKGVTLYAIFDCCHSGTMMDLRFKYDAKAKKLTMNEKIPQADAFVLMISGCMDAQTSADLPPGFDKLIKESVGALSGCLYPMIAEKKSWETLINDVRKKLKSSALEQIPQVEASRDFDVTDAAFKYAFKTFQAPPPTLPDPTVPVGINRALVIGVNYIGGAAPLGGCINDAKMALEFLHKNGLPRKPRDSYVLLTEEKGELRPTRKNILKGLHWLTKGSKPGETLWFHFSGHGAQAADKEKDELDGIDETICPVDYESAGMITDDEIKRMLVDVLPKGVTLYAIFDCCHSGTIMDLRFHYDAKSKTMSMSDENKATECNVVMISGCMANQTSADLPPGFDKMIAESVGALSGCLYPMIQQKHTWTDLIENVRKSLKKSKLDQVPQLEAGKNLEMTEVAFRRVWSNS